MATLELEARLDNLLVTVQEETVDIDLFAPIQEREECPICMIPFPVDDNNSKSVIFFHCCGKNVCNGCSYKLMMNTDGFKCAFCCQIATSSAKHTIKAYKRLMKNNNPKAFIMMAGKYKSGQDVIQSNTKALEMYIRAAELGNTEAYLNIGCCYELGIVLVERDISKALTFYELV